VAFTRLFRNRHVSKQEIIRTAAARTAEMAAGRHVLIIEDSSEINYEAKALRKRGLGRVGNGKDVGLFVHPALAVDAADGSVLGLAGATIWRREAKKADDYQALPIEAKESYKWIAAAQAARQALTETPLATVIGDREADIYEVFARLPDERTHVLIRAVRDRALGTRGERLFSAIAKTPEARPHCLRAAGAPWPAGPHRRTGGSLHCGELAPAAPRRRQPRSSRTHAPHGGSARDRATFAEGSGDLAAVDHPQRRNTRGRLSHRRSLSLALERRTAV